MSSHSTTEYSSAATEGSSSSTRPVLRVGLIGVTGYGQCYFEGFSKLVDAGMLEWGAVTIINPDEAPEQEAYFKKRKVRIYRDYLEMLDREKDHLDWVGIPTGIGWHRRMVMDCLERGLQVLVEKPLAPTVQDMNLIQEMERTTGLRVAVGFQHLYQEENWEIKRRLLDGCIGELERIDCIGMWPRNQSYYDRNRWSGTLHDGKSWILDSPLNNALAHIANLMLFFAGSELEQRGYPEQVSAELYRCKPIASFDTVRSSLRFPGGLEASLMLTHACQHQMHPEIRITGTRGKVIWRFSNFHTLVADGKTETFQGMGHIPMREKMFEQLLGYFAGEPTRICTTEQAGGVAQWVNAVHDAAPIVDVAEEHLTRIPEPPGDALEVINDMEYYGLRSYYENRSFAGLGAPWAVPPREMDVKAYPGFEARHHPEPVPSIP